MTVEHLSLPVISSLLPDLPVISSLSPFSSVSPSPLPGPSQQTETGCIQAKMCKTQGLLKDFPTVFKDCKLMKNTDISVKILFLKC